MASGPQGQWKTTSWGQVLVTETSTENTIIAFKWIGNQGDLRAPRCEEAVAQNAWSVSTSGDNLAYILREQGVMVENVDVPTS